MREELTQEIFPMSIQDKNRFFIDKYDLLTYFSIANVKCSQAGLILRINFKGLINFPSSIKENRNRFVSLSLKSLYFYHL